MNRLFLISLIAVITFFSYQQISFAVCVEGPPDTFICNTNPPNPDPEGIQQFGNNNDLTVNVLPGAAIDTSLQPATDDDGIQIGDGNNIITVDNGSVIGQDGGIQTGEGNNQIIISDSEVQGITEDTIRTDQGNDIINIDNSVITALRLIRNNLFIYPFLLFLIKLFSSMLSRKGKDWKVESRTRGWVSLILLHHLHQYDMKSFTREITLYFKACSNYFLTKSKKKVRIMSKS